MGCQNIGVIMGDRIDVRKVAGVLLADGWHEVVVGSFEIEPLELIGFNGSAFRFADRKGSGSVRGPLSSLLAVRVRA